MDQRRCVPFARNINTWDPPEIQNREIWVMSCCGVSPTYPSLKNIVFQGFRRLKKPNKLEKF